MKMTMTSVALAAAVLMPCAFATENQPAHNHANRAVDHAPIGVMGDHTHDKGEWMLSYRAMRMEMQGSRDGTTSLSPTEIATTVPNRFAGRPGQPPTLRVVPEDMSMTMHMLGVMYAPHERVTLMAMFNVLDYEMDHVTFQGGMGANKLGNFTTSSSGLGDTRVAALTRLGSWGGARLHSTFGVSIPTGDFKATDEILTPMNTRPEPRLPYPMQLGSGTWDLISGLTLVRDANRFSTGAQWQSIFRLGENSADYRLGHEHRLSGWYAYSVTNALSVSARLEALRRNKIRGADPQIVAPVQTADPGNHGGTIFNVGIGANALLFDRHRLGLELLLPLHRDLHGPQLETDWQLTLGYQLAF